MASETLPEHPELPFPPAEKLNPHFILGEIRDYIQEFSSLFPLVNLDILKDQATDVRRKNVSAEAQIRQFLKAFHKTETFRDAFEQLDPDTQKKVQAFTHGQSAEAVTKASGFGLPPSPATKHHFKLLDLFHSLFRSHDKHGVPEPTVKAEGGSHDPPVIYEDADHKEIMQVYINHLTSQQNWVADLSKAYADIEFQNWGESIKNKPKYTFVPTKTLGLQNLVKYAKENNFRVRCAGYRHSWSDTFSADNEILVSLLGLKEVNSIPDPLAIGPTHEADGNELMSIDILPKPSLSTAGKDCVRVGAAVTNEAFRRWAIKNNKCALPMDVILVEYVSNVLYHLYLQSEEAPEHGMMAPGADETKTVVACSHGITQNRWGFLQMTPEAKPPNQ